MNEQDNKPCKHTVATRVVVVLVVLQLASLYNSFTTVHYLKHDAKPVQCVTEETTHAVE